MRQYAQLSIAAGVSWVLFFAVLFGGVVRQTSVVREYGCTVRDFHVDPRFDCYKRCSVTDGGSNVVVSKAQPDDYTYLSADDAIELMAEIERSDITMTEEQFIALLETVEDIKKGRGEKDHEKYPDCDELERDILDAYSPKLCLDALYGFEDPLCPPENTLCYTGNKWKRKCGLYCPLAYNITLNLDVDHMGKVDKSRDLSTDRDRYMSYKDYYEVGKRLACQVVKDPTGNNDVLFVDERMSHEALQWWKWSLFSGSLLLALLTSVASVVSYVKFRNNSDLSSYQPLGNNGDASDEI